MKNALLIVLRTICDTVFTSHVRSLEHGWL